MAGGRRIVPAPSGATAERPCHSHQASAEAAARRFSNVRALAFFVRVGFAGMPSRAAALLPLAHDCAAVIWHDAAAMGAPSSSSVSGSSIHTGSWRGGLARPRRDGDDGDDALATPSRCRLGAVLPRNASASRARTSVIAATWRLAKRPPPNVMYERMVGAIPVSAGSPVPAARSYEVPPASALSGSEKVVAPPAPPATPAKGSIAARALNRAGAPNAFAGAAARD